jgi:hypothetical protein
MKGSVNSSEELLPDLLQCGDGRQIGTTEGWRQRRPELLRQILDIEYGQLPPVPGHVQAQELHSHTAHRFAGAHHVQYRLECAGGQFGSFVLDLLIPSGEGPFPVVLTGDGCWCSVSDEVAHEVLRRGNILARFNRTEIAVDAGATQAFAGCGALAAWAWGYHRCVDFLLTQNQVDWERIAIVGHSRGGKATLLAGATDERIALTSANNSGCGGAGCFRLQGEGSETLPDILRSFAYWFGPRLSEYVGRESQLPFDQHSLKALIAPRALLTTEALGDHWANPSGTWHTHTAARRVYAMLGVPDEIGIHYREGGHQHGIEDWRVFLDFMDWRLRGRPAERRFDVNPSRR